MVCAILRDKHSLFCYCLTTFATYCGRAEIKATIEQRY